MSTRTGSPPRRGPRPSSSTASRPGSRWASLPSRRMPGSCCRRRPTGASSTTPSTRSLPTAARRSATRSTCRSRRPASAPALPPIPRRRPRPRHPHPPFPPPRPTAPAFPPPSPPPSASPAPSGGTDDKGTPLTAVVLLSDGKSSTGQLDPMDAADEAAQAGVPVYTIALGTDKGSVEVTDQFGQPQTIPVPPDPATLADVAERTGARFFAAPSSSDLQAIYQGIGSKVGFTNEEREVTQWFAAGALVLVVAGAGLAAFWFNRIP